MTDADPETTLTGYSDARIEEVFNDLGTMQVQLDSDPLAYGPKRLNAKVAEARGMLSRCERTFTQVSKDLLALQRRHRARETEFKIKMSDLFANDPETRAGRNVSDREALARTKLKEDVQEIARLENLIQDLQTLMTVIKAKRADLRDVMGRLKDQIRLCQEETGLGGRWGSQVPGAVPLTPGIGASAVGSGLEMAEVLAGVQSEIHLAKAEGRFPEAQRPGFAQKDSGEEDKEALRALARVQAAEPPVEITVPPEKAVDITTGHKPEVSMAAPDEKPLADESGNPCAEVVMGSPLPEPEAVALPGATATSTEVDDFLAFGLDEAVPGAKAPAAQPALPPQDDLLDALIDKFDEAQKSPR